ncbi:alpha/beta hydrolase [Cryobacterium sp. PH31-AA6]|uniref:alpha/beta hydrolase n=1 Tax=Cryobacterium sp. PH31-AA6 TaxID=3046205 RepID=UPI0024B9020E|nr:alpha/beta hydrolase [Cryobacterium sp. PH31-AA6]MDJ0323340.1 alpha/beta hydrolase [Cryobacterium sp. PH31-AA6]
MIQTHHAPQTTKQQTTKQQTTKPHKETALSRVPVWVWRALMHRIAPGELHKFNAEPIDTVDYHFDLDYAGDGIRDHRLDVLVPHDSPEPLPVYIYFHGGGWTSGDKAPLTKYCASQAADGMIVVNANYRMATSFQLKHMLEDANDVLDWVARNIERFGGDPTRIVLGGDSAGGHIAALLAASAYEPRLAAYYGIRPRVEPENLRGLVQHCSIADVSVIFERGFVLSLNFLRILLPARGRGLVLRAAARFMSPIEWLDSGFPPVFVTTSERDYFYRANLNFIAALRRRSIVVDTLIYERGQANTHHTWQQDARHPESQEVYRRLGAFVRRVAALPVALPTALPAAGPIGGLQAV